MKGLFGQHFMQSGINSQKIFKKISHKFCSNNGETIAETLVSLLISSLALTMLAGAITTTQTNIKKSRIVLSGYYDQNEKDDGVVKMSGTGKDGSVEITEITGSSSVGLKTIDEPVEYFENTGFGTDDDKKVIAYEPK